mgnify:CR=1 FL=1
MITFITTILLYLGIIFPASPAYQNTNHQASERIYVQPDQKIKAKKSRDHIRLQEVVQHDVTGL